MKIQPCNFKLNQKVYFEILGEKKYIVVSGYVTEILNEGLIISESSEKWGDFHISYYEELYLNKKDAQKSVNKLNKKK